MSRLVLPAAAEQCGASVALRAQGWLGSRSVCCSTSTLYTAAHLQLPQHVAKCALALLGTQVLQLYSSAG
jgi:hypothetical protein